MPIKIVKTGEEEHGYTERYMKFVEWMTKNEVKPLTHSQHMLAECLLATIGDKQSIFENIEKFTREEIRKKYRPRE
jgi:hypothetical protein